MAKDCFSKWPNAILSNGCSAKAVLKLLQEIIIRDGVPGEIKTDHAAVFKSQAVKEFCEDWGIKHRFGTPYVHSSVGVVERHLRTFQDSLKTFLLEEGNFRKAVSRALYVMRFTLHQTLKTTPFEKHYGRKPVRKLENLLNLDFPLKDLLESVRDANGKAVAENFYSKEELEDLDNERRYGRSRNQKDLRELLKSNKPVGKFVVLK